MTCKKEYITSRQNPLMTHIRKLASSASYRRQKGEYLGDGVKLLEEALRWAAELTVVVTTQQVEPNLPEGVRHVVVPEDVMRSVSPSDTPQGALFLASRPTTDLPENLGGSRYLILDGVQDPGNVGTIWRTADAFGADGLILLAGCADPFSPKVVRATMGAAFRLPVYVTSIDVLQERLLREEIPLWATALRADAEDVRRAELDRCAVVIGSEGRGVSPQVLEKCERAFLIPMRERCESLNAAVAAGVVLWEMFR